MAGSTQGEIRSQLGGTAVVTGATGSLGYETALGLAKAGAEVILTGRDDRKGQSALENIGREVISAKITFESLDLASLASIADFAQRMHSRTSLDILINMRKSSTSMRGCSWTDKAAPIPGLQCAHRNLFRRQQASRKQQTHDQDQRETPRPNRPDRV